MTHAPQPVTRALVLAAGLGSRLRSDTPKPLLPVLGVPLLARTLFTLREAGVTDAWVVVGYEAERVVQGMARWMRPGLRVHWVHNPEWERPNGISVLAGEAHLDEPFFLTMTDHLFQADVPRSLAAQGPGGGLNLAVDYDVDGVLDLDDATKVRVRDGRIEAIGKQLETFDAIDTGVFLASPELFAALREAVAEGEESLSAGVQRLAARGQARVTDVTGCMWQDVDTPTDFAAARRKLLASVRKASDGPVSRYINRPISIALSRLLVHTPVTPNQISIAALVISLVSAWFATRGDYAGFLIAGLLFQIASIVDGTDGEVAKLTFQSSRRGEWIDTVCDNVSYLAFLLAVIVGVSRAGLPDFYLQTGLLGAVAAAGSIANLMAYVAREKRSGSFLSVRYGYEDGTGWFARVMRVLHFMGKRDFFAFFAFVLALFGQLPLALPLFGVGATLLLFPATLKANVSSWMRHRRARAAAAPPAEPDLAANEAGLSSTEA
ncbi:MAG: hypothetical protein D6701_03605 [Gemmatimonadetes bacterium]|nr:MAG: hypothetical protein D6701_03605 [Gemmatimonadota bacterium]